MKNVALFLFALLLPFITLSQSPEWINYTSGKTITAIVPEGNMLWVGTTGGLVSIDTLSGVTRFYNMFNSGLPSNQIHEVVVDSLGNKWIATYNQGIARFDGAGWTVFGFQQGVPSFYGQLYESRRMFVDPDNQLWIRYWDRLIKIRDDSVFTYDASNFNGLLGEHITSMAVDTSGTIWVGTQNAGILRYNPATGFDTLNTADGLPENAVKRIFIDPGGAAWISTQNFPLAKLKQNKWTFYSQVTTGIWGFDYSSISDMAFHPDGRIWILDSGGRMIMFNGSKWIMPTSGFDSSSGCYGRIMCAVNDRLWIGTNSCGLFENAGNVLVPRGTSNSGLPGNVITDMEIEGERQVWIASDGNAGLTTFDGEEWMVFDSISGLYGSPWDIAVGAQGHKWINALFCAGQLSDAGWKMFCPAVLPGDNFFDAVAAGPDPFIWLKAYTHLVRLDGESWFYYPFPEDLVANISSYKGFVTDGAGNVWVSLTGGEGVLQWNGSSWTHFNDLGFGAGESDYPQIFTDRQGNLWAYSPERGFSTFDGANWIVYSKQTHHLPENVGQGFTTDVFGNIWYSSENGLAKFNGDTTIVFSVPGAESYWTTVNVMASDPYGNIWIGGRYGLALFNENGVVFTAQHEAKKTPSFPVKIFPNPASDHFRVRIEESFSADDNDFFLLFNVMGKEVLRQALTSSEFQIRRGNLEGGVYFYTVLKNGTAVASGKILFTE